ncbi:spore wall maturation protein DIT1 [Aspergillus udagawae]|nr:spore wall maturation protein DIT1 [Aspergillus udagawae]
MITVLQNPQGDVVSYPVEPQENALLGSYGIKTVNVETTEVAASSSDSEVAEDCAEERHREESFLLQPLSEADRHEQTAANGNTESELDIPPVTGYTPESSDNPLVEAKEEVPEVPVTFKHEGEETKDDTSCLLAVALGTAHGEENRRISEDEATAITVLKVIESYGVNFEKSGASWQGLTSFIPTVVEQVKKREPVRMILPAFPFKSPNARDKVLGVMPDLGEELALYHLNALCDNIGRVYEPAADVYISSDGLVYNDILGVPDETVWEYGEALRRMAVEKELHHVKFIRLFELLEHPWIPLTSAEQAKSYYLAHAQCLRRELMYRFEDRSFDADTAIRNDNDTCLTYRGYIKFLTKDLAPQMDTQYTSKKARAAHIAQTARSMIVRGKMFAAAIKANRADYVRLSIHESNGAKKLSISLVPQVRGALGYTPWHSSIAVGADGTFRTVHAEDVRETHDLVYKNGQPYYFREKSKLFDWVEDGLRVKFEHLYPCGLVIRPSDVDDSRPPPSIRDLPMHKVRQLSTGLSPVILRGFRETLEEELYVQKASELGTILPWSFGIIQKVRDAGRTDKLGNNVTSNEAMPMHYDGMFKFEEETDPVTGEIKRVQKPPGFQFFTCPATAPKGSGYTLFASSRLFFRYLPLPWTAERLQTVTWAMDNDGFWDAKLKNLPLVVPHPVTGLPCMRWHQPWDSTKTKFSTCAVTIENDEQELVSVVDDLTYDYRVCLRFSWEQGDLLVSDNTAMLHTRTGYKTDCDRELWRIHFD